MYSVTWFITSFCFVGVKIGRSQNWKTGKVERIFLGTRGKIGGGADQKTPGILLQYKHTGTSPHFHSIHHVGYPVM